jgi:hypothetical protein
MSVDGKWRHCAWILLLLLPVGCQKEESRWDQAHQESQGQSAVSAESEAGSSFNKFFPKVEAPFDLVYKQEKTGFAEASLKHEGKEVAILSISDTRNNPESADKYKESSEKLGEYPLARVGSQGTGVLVADRFQVQARSMDPAFGETERKAWLERFDLSGLSQLQ